MNEVLLAVIIVFSLIGLLVIIARRQTTKK